ncbi:DNA repair protein RecN [Proteiniphilum saccharofermentans]|uniref:DNA repair protein RecN n=1 Tax=Proteiniphilum saccharofermentans TaxID=1642647 RepID=A0A1R3T3F4_9BACT|nr:MULTISPECIES: DNA repair protein RecN [Proteiniphilum]MDY9919474.1 DNA repair protein RecN [Proteiniphilum sp.]SCD21710.1 DNA repair protein RecN [Proteiniphilum saccharofermentans]SEA03383.1 DNA replication and repair protein RecN [Porphyromonadaceae bacterium KH3R12]
MLKSLYIQNFALIDSLRIGFDPGFSVISGETGAGKSIILGALSLILGQRADVKQIKQDAERCVIEGVFDVSAYHLASFFEEMDWVYDGEECILRREIWSNGKSRAFVNDSPVYLNDLKGLGDRLIDIHSQHQNLSLNDNFFQLNVVDLLADTRKERADYGEAYAVYRASERALGDLREQSRKNREEEDYLRFQYSALEEMNLQPGEQAQLEEELEAVSHAEEIKTGLYAATALLSEEERSVESMLRTVADTLHNVQRFYPKLSELVSRVDSAFIELKDVREEIAGYFEEVEFDPGRRELLEERLSAIYDLQKKHSATTVEELITLRDEMGRKLENIDSLDERLQALEKETGEKRETMMARAEMLSVKRKKAIPRIEKELVERLAYLRMPNVKFQCEFKTKEMPDATGADTVQFLFSANKNVAPQPVSQIASGGEMSRLMLCIKSMIAGATSLPTIIFDEIDTGTSGEVADRVGAIMEEMGTRMQVIGITHLPQIASKGTAHFLVYKEDLGNIVTTKIKELTPEERIQEIARMLSGAEITEQAIENAKVMLNRN